MPLPLHQGDPEWSDPLPYGWALLSPSQSLIASDRFFWWAFNVLSWFQFRRVPRALRGRHLRPCQSWLLQITRAAHLTTTLILPPDIFHNFYLDAMWRWRRTTMQSLMLVLLTTLRALFEWRLGMSYVLHAVGKGAADQGQVCKLNMWDDLKKEGREERRGTQKGQCVKSMIPPTWWGGGWSARHRNGRPIIGEVTTEGEIPLRVLVLVLVFRLVLAFILLHLCFESRSSSWRERSWRSARILPNPMLELVAHKDHNHLGHRRANRLDCWLIVMQMATIERVSEVKG